MISEIVESVVLGYGSFYLFLAEAIGSYGIAAMSLSFLVSLLLISPMRWASRITRNEHEIQAVISPQITRIKSDCEGAVQHARINALYSRYAYHPLYSIRLVAGLFIQLPFLVLSFVMFEGLDAIDGKAFFFIDDLGRPDNLLYANGNLLPFLMTAINLAAALFIPRFTGKDLIQAVFVSLLFFALLYTAKSVLLLFWTTNNVISLVRNISLYRQAAADSRFDFRRFRFKLQLFLQRREPILFFLVFFAYTQILLFVFTKSYNQVLTKAFYAASILILLGLVAFHLTLYLKGFWGAFNRINRKKALALPDVNMGDTLVVLIPFAIIIQYSLLNQELLTVREQILFGTISYFLLFFGIWLIPFLLQRMLPVVALVPLALTLAIFYVSMPTFVIVSSWVENPDLALLAISFLVLFALFFLLYIKKQKTLQALSIVFFIVSTLITVYNIYVLEDAAEVNPYLKKMATVDFTNFLPTEPMKNRPDVFLLTYDGYVGQETMQKYGIDNTEQEDFLKRNGFRTYPEAYSVAWESLDSMSRVLEMTRDLGKSPRFSVAGNALVPAIFKQNGYKTHGVIFPLFLKHQVGYDFAFPPKDTNQTQGIEALFEGLIEGEFRFELINKPRNYERAEWLETKRAILGSQTTYPKFMYTHTGPGHSQNSGTCLPNETELYRQRLLDANEEMRQDIGAIFASKRDAIIIVSGDHGPYLTEDCAGLHNLSSVEEVTKLHLQDRVGTFLAIRWPQQSSEKYDNIRTIQDTFESVFKYLFATEKVLRHRPSTATIPLGKSVPEGVVEDGKILVGSDKGKLLFGR